VSLTTRRQVSSPVQFASPDDDTTLSSDENREEDVDDFLSATMSADASLASEGSEETKLTLWTRINRLFTVNADLWDDQG
jgi:hypothetical protein